MNIDGWRHKIIAADWRTSDVDLVSLVLAARYRSNMNTTVLLPCGDGLALEIDCDRQSDALDLLEQHGFVSTRKGGVTDGCCFECDSIEITDNAEV